MKEIIVSTCDNCFHWSFRIRNKTYTDIYYHYHFKKFERLGRINSFASILETDGIFTTSDLKMTILRLWPHCKKIIWCNDGYIEIIKIRKGAK